MLRLRLGTAVVVALLAGAGCATPAARPTVDRAAPLSVRDAGGAALDLDADLAAGRHVALVFWQTWCEPCEREAPNLAAASRRHGDAIRFVGVVPGDVAPAEVIEKAKSWGLAYPQVVDATLELSTRFDVQGTPTIVVLGAGRKELYRGHRAPEDWAALRGAGRRHASAAECPDGICAIGGAAPKGNAP